MAVQILGSVNVEVGADGTEAEGVVGVKDVDVALLELLDQVRDELGIHNIVVLFVGSVEHRSDNHCGVANVVSEQGGLFKTHPVCAVNGLGNGVGVAVELVGAVVGNGHMTLGLLGDHLSELLGGLVVPLFGVEDVGELYLQVEIVCAVIGCSVVGVCCIVSLGGFGLSVVCRSSGLSASAESEYHNQSEKHGNDFLHFVFSFTKFVFRHSVILRAVKKL